MITRNFKLFLNAGKQIPLMINVSQYDHGEKWVFTLYDDHGQKYTPSTGAIVGIKADNLGIINTGTVNSAGQVEIMETQQMTAAAGKAVFELLIDGDTHGTANFVVLVEPKPGDQADMSTSDLSLLQQAINSIAIAGSGAPAVATLAADMTDEGKIYLYAGSETGYTAGDWYYYNGASWVDGGTYGGVVDDTLTQPGQAADAKKTGDEISDLKSQLNNAMPVAVKLALDNMLAHVPFNDWDASSDYATFHAWASEVVLLSISAVFTQGDNVIYTHDSLNSLKQYLTVTAHFDDGTDTVVTNYELSGTLTAGTSTITVTYQGKTDTFSVTVTQGIPDGYTKVSYIYTASPFMSGDVPSQYINLPYSSDSSKTYTLETGVRYAGAIGTQNVQIMGFNGFGYFGWQRTSGCYVIDAIAQTGSNTGVVASTTEFDDLVCSINPSVGNTLSINGVSFNSTRSSWTADKPLCLFAINSGSVVSQANNVSMNYFRLYINDVLTMNLFPCYRNSDNEAGMYDIIGGAFYPSNGTGSFAYEA